MKRRVVLAIVLVLDILLVLALVAVSEFHGVGGGPIMKTGRGNGGSYVILFPTALSCSIQNGSCEIAIRNMGTYSAQTVGCVFQNIYAIEGNGQTVTNYRTVTNNQTLTMSTVNVGTGVLSNQPKGLPFTTTIPANSSAIVYCTPSVSVPTPTVGGQANGEVQFTNNTVPVQFSGRWGK